MHLLVTNDDGIDCVFLHALIHALTQAGHTLSVAAPVREQSWIGAAKSRYRPVTSHEVDKGFGCPTWAIDGTPSDCVNIGLNHFVGSRPDAVVSGMNVGFNASLGFIIASGTIGGAWEGALHGLPAFAFSQDMAPEAFEAFRQRGNTADAPLALQLRQSAARAASLVSEWVPATPPRTFKVHNINLPANCLPDSPVMRTVPSRLIVPSLFSPREDDGTHHFVFQRGEELPSPDGAPMSDRAALAAGMVSHTVLDYTRLGHV